MKLQPLHRKNFWNTTFKETPICNAANRGCVAMKGECGLYTSMFSNVSAWLLIWIQCTLYICIQKKPVNNSVYLCNMYVFLFLKDSTECVATAYGKWLSCTCLGCCINLNSSAIWLVPVIVICFFDCSTEIVSILAWWPAKIAEKGGMYFLDFRSAG